MLRKHLIQSLENLSRDLGHHGNLPVSKKTVDDAIEFLKAEAENRQKKIREKIEKIHVYSWFDGAVLFDIDLCTEDELSRIRSSGMLDTLARILSEID